MLKGEALSQYLQRTLQGKTSIFHFLGESIYCHGEVALLFSFCLALLLWSILFH